MEAFKSRETDFPTYQVNTKNFLTQPQPLISYYLKATPTGRFKAGNKTFRWQELLKKGSLATFRFCEDTFNSDNQAEADYFEAIPKKLLDPQVKIVIRDYCSGNDDYQTSYNTKIPRVPGYFVCSLVHEQDF
jgi:hypothetical protein